MTTVYIAGLYEFIENGATDKVTKYYEGNALRRSGYGVDDGVFYLLRDHLSSSSVILNQSGTVVTNGNQYYTTYGSNRGGTPFSTVTTKRFTGQYHENGLTQSEGVSYYGARWYDAKLGRFLSADSIVPRPANPQAFNRYSYVYNNPLKYIDPTGHCGVTSDNVSMQAELGCNDGGGIGIGGRSSNISSGGGWFSGLTKWFSSWRSSSSTSAESPWIQMNPYGAQRTLPASNSVNNARNLIPIELSSSAKPVTIVAQNAQPLIRADLPQTVISAHGQYDPLLPAIRQPGTTLVYYAGPGGQITNELGNLIELGQAPANVVRFVYPPGTNAPNLVLSRLSQRLIKGNPT